MLEQVAATFAGQVLVLRNLIQTGLGRDHCLAGLCEVHFPEHPPCSFSLDLAPGRIAFGPVGLRQPDASVEMGRAALEAIVQAAGNVDVRRPHILKALNLSGDRDLAGAVIFSVQRPAAGAPELLARLEARSRASGRRIEAVERREALDEEEVLRFVEEGLPVIVTGALRDRPFSGLTIDEFAACYGHAPVAIPLEPAPVRLDAYLATLRAEEGRRLYTMGTSLPEILWPIFAPVYLRDRVSPPQLWFGAGASPTVPVTQLHRDLGTGFLMQVFGRKRMVLFAPHEAEFLYPRASYIYYQQCWVNIAAPDLERHPRFAEAHPVEVVLEPGEILIQPTGWFHEVYSLDGVTMSVSNFLPA